MATTTHDLKLRAILDVSQVKQQVQQLNSKNTVNLDASGISHSINLLNQTISKFTSSLENLSKNTQQAAVKINNSSNQAVSNWSQIGKFAAGFAVEHIGNKARDYFQAVGNETAADTSDFLSKVGRGALVGSAAGWIGAAGGAIFGGVEFALEQLAGNAKKAAEELAAYQQVLTEARTQDQIILARENTEKFNTLLSTGTRQQLEAETYWRKLTIADADAKKQAFRSQFGENAIENATKRIQALKEEREVVTDKLSNLIREDIGDMTVSDDLSEIRADEKHLRGIDAQIAQITNDIESYKKAEDERVKYTNELKQLNIVIAQRKASEEQAAKAAEAKAEIERKAIEAEKKRIEIEAQRNEAIIKRLRQTDTEGEESDEISNMLKGGNLQMLNKMLTSVQAKAAWAEDEYNKYLEAGDGDKATESRRQLIRYRGYESSITSGIEGLKSKDISELGDQYSSLLNQLNKVLQPSTSVSELQAQGFGMGWVDAPVDSIEDNVSKIANKMIELIGLIRNTEQDGGSTLW